MTGLRLAYHDMRAPATQAWARQLEGVDFLLLDRGPLQMSSATLADEQLEHTLRTLSPQLYMDSQIRLLASLAGREPAGAVAPAAEILISTGNAELPVAIVRGQDVLDRLEELLLHTDLAHAESGQRFVELSAKTVAAVAALGPRPTAQAVKQGARLVMVAHEEPGILSEAAAWVASAKRENTPARRLGQTLADCFPQVVGDASSRDNWAHDQTLQAELAGDDRIDFFGRSDLIETAQQRLATPRSQTDPNHTRLILIYLEGYQAKLVLTVADPAARGRLETLLANAPPEIRACTTGVKTPTDAAVIELRLFHSSQPAVERAAGELAGVLDLAGGVLGIQRIGGPPTTQPVHATWPTTLPPELLEWSVDIKPAHQWLD